MDTPDLAELKTAFTVAVAAGDVPTILSTGRKLLSRIPSLGTAAQVLRGVPVNLPNRTGITVKIAVLRSFTIEPAVPLIRALARLHGIDAAVKVGEFNSYIQEIIDPNSWLYEFDPDIVILAAQTRDVAPDLWQRGPNASMVESDELVKSVTSPITSLIAPLRARSNASLIIHSFEEPSFCSSGLLDGRHEIGQSSLISMMNAHLKRCALDNDGVYVLNYDGLIAKHGRSRWHDETKWLTTRSPISSECLIFLAEEYLRFMLPLCGRVSKVLAVDLDNTLWGGVIGEDGLNGIKIGPEYPGAAFLELQKAILDLHERGILLAICSKNNVADAMEALEGRQEMVLRPSHFSAIRINWLDKAQNLRDIASELNVGIDSLAFIDDNPVERERVMHDIPELFVVDLPNDPMGYAAALRSAPVFERLSITAEDKDRGKYYAQQRERLQMESTAGSLEEFYRSLEMRAEFVDVTPETLARIAQLTQKTNQLNMTTRRSTEAEVLAMAQDPTWRIFGIKVVDKFGDNGLVGIVILKYSGLDVLIDTFLLSCRVIGRTVETAMLAKVRELALAANCTRILGWFLPTRKNMPAAKIYPLHDFVIAKETNDGILWQTTVDNGALMQPEWIQ
jgi:FkbH-like protein